MPFPSSFSIRRIGILSRRFISRKSLFYVPGNNQRKLTAALSLPADTIVFDLEDSVPFANKHEARTFVKEFLSKSVKGEKAVRINSIGSGLEKDDLEAIKDSPIKAIVIPKVERPEQIQIVAKYFPSNVDFIVCIESALGLLHLTEIATSHPNIKAIVFAAEDYCADTGIIRSPNRQEFMYARQKIITTCVALGLQSIDLVCVDYKNPETLKEECSEASQWGFTGKQAIHPSQIAIIHDYFTPHPEQITKAKRILEGYDHYQKLGIGAFELDGKMVDMPVIKWAQRLLSRQ